MKRALLRTALALVASAGFTLAGQSPTATDAMPHVQWRSQTVDVSRVGRSVPIASTHEMTIFRRPNGSYFVVWANDGTVENMTRPGGAR